MNESLLKTQAYIDGQWLTTDNQFKVDNPFDNSHLADVTDCNQEQFQQAIDAASNAFTHWSQTSPKYRSKLLLAWYQNILEHQDDLAHTLTLEQGKPIAEARNEIVYGANYIKWFSEEALRINGDILQSGLDKQTQVLKLPVGVVGIITPWNFPQAMIARKVAPALAAGCTVVIKPAAETPLSALAMAELAHQIGIPKGVINIIPTTRAKEFGKAITASKKVRKISFTGSTAVGKLLLKQAADNVQRTTMELGGNAPFIVFDDADIDAAIDGLMVSKFRNSGQTCVCANRIFIHDSVYDQFAKQFVEKVKTLSVDNGLNETAKITALINPKAVSKVSDLVIKAKQQGAQVLFGGSVSPANHNIFLPTVLSDVQADMSIACEEIFGPVAPLIRFNTEQQVIDLANNTDAGLACYVFTEDRHRIRRLSHLLEFGMIAFNEGAISNEMAPFGGVKHSGMGREGSKYGIDDYLELKYVSVS
ncbi:MAG: NAD-dependent succinate-semialdehyde dehydrogenase [Kangiellaceae bacterium]|nr:NAD-dependent succinate-semialdehyde dehydrogenase [Kangiellaceae bacterium]